MLRWNRWTTAAGVALATLAAGTLPALAQPTATAVASGAPTVAGRATYHVSPRGSDAADGRSPASAWATLERASRADLEPGDVLALEGGAVFAGTLQLTAEDAGTAAQPVVITSYGTGRARIAAGTRTGISTYQIGGVEIRGVDVVGAGSQFGTSNGVSIYADLPGDVRLPPVAVTDVAASGFGDSGVSIGTWNGKTGFDGIRVERVVATDNGIAGIMTYAAVPNTHRNVVIRGSRASENPGRPELDRNSGSGIVVGGADGALVERNVASANGGLGRVSEGPVGIWAYDSTRVVIRRNESFANRTGGPNDGGGFDLDQNVTDSVVEFNYSHDNDGPGFLLVQSPSTTTHRRNVIRHNISQHDGRRNGAAAVEVYGAVRDADIHSNTVVVGRGPTTRGAAVRVRAASGAPRPRAVTVRNNIVLVMANSPGAAPNAPELDLVDVGFPASAAEVAFQGNAYSATTLSRRYVWAGRVYGSLAAWRRATGQERLDGVDTGVQTPPGLLRPGTAPTLASVDDFTPLAAHYGLRADSPLVDQGLDLDALGSATSPTDLFGTPVPSRGRRDVGAAELP